MHTTGGLAEERLVHRKCPTGRLESHCDCSHFLEITFLGCYHKRKALNHFVSHCISTWAFRDNPSFIISFPCPNPENVLCFVGKDQKATTAYTGLSRLPDQTHTWNSSKKESSAQREGDRGFWLCEVPSPQWQCLFTGCPYYLHFLPLQNVWCYLWNHTGTEYR